MSVGAVVEPPSDPSELFRMRYIGTLDIGVEVDVLVEELVIVPTSLPS